MKNNPNRSWFITGATGFLGRELLRRILVRTADPVSVLVRARGAGADERIRALLGDLYEGDVPADVRARVTVYAGDTSEPKLGLDAQAWQRLSRSTHIVHLAACTRFDMAFEEISRHNVDGVANLLELAAAAQAAGTLRRVAHVSTAYVAGASTAQVDADTLDLDGAFRNTYERSKAEGEALVRRRFGALPITVFRPAIVIGDSRTGEVNGVNTIYWSIKAYLRGMRLLLARVDTPLDLVPVDYVCDALLNLVERDETIGRCFLLAGGERTTISLGELAVRICNYLETTPPRVLPPALFSVLRIAQRLPWLSTRHRRLVRNVGSYLPYFVSNPTFDTRTTENALAGSGISVPPFDAYVGRLIDYCLKQGWGDDSPTLRSSRRADFRAIANRRRADRLRSRDGERVPT